MTYVSILEQRDPRSPSYNGYSDQTSLDRDDILCSDCREYHHPDLECVDAAREALPRAGARLDKARARFAEVSNAPGAVDEREFAKRQDSYLAAKKAYSALLELATGEAADTVWMRLAA